MYIIYFIIFFLIMYFIGLLKKYSGMEKPEFELQYFRDFEYIKYSPIIVGFLNDKKIKEEHFIATALSFVTKGYIKLEKLQDNSDYIFTIIKKINTNDIELEALQVFFNTYPKVGVKQSLRQFKKIIKNEKKYGHFGELKRTFNNMIRNFFDKKEDIKKITKNTNIKNIILCYFLFIIVCFVLKFNSIEFKFTNLILSFITISFAFLFFIANLSFIKYSLLGNFSWILPIMTSYLFIQTLTIVITTLVARNLILIISVLILMGFIILFDDMLQRKKTNIANTSEMIKGLKKYIIEYSNIDEYDLSNIYLWEDYYVYAITLNIKKIY